MSVANLKSILRTASSVSGSRDVRRPNKRNRDCGSFPEGHVRAPLSECLSHPGELKLVNKTQQRFVHASRTGRENLRMEGVYKPALQTYVELHRIYRTQGHTDTRTHTRFNTHHTILRMFNYSRPRPNGPTPMPAPLGPWSGPPPPAPMPPGM